MNNSTLVRLHNVRLSYPNLFEARKFSPTDAKGSYSATFILDKKNNAKEIAEIKKAIDDIVREKFKGKHPGAQRICLRDGSEKQDVTGYGPDIMFVSARSDQAPMVVTAQRIRLLTQTEEAPLAGDFVNATIDIWAQDNAYGKRINAKLRGVMFAKRGERFGNYVDPVNEFAAFADDDESPV